MSSHLDHNLYPIEELTPQTSALKGLESELNEIDYAPAVIQGYIAQAGFTHDYEKELTVAVDVLAEAVTALIDLYVRELDLT